MIHTALDLIFADFVRDNRIAVVSLSRQNFFKQQVLKRKCQGAKFIILKFNFYRADALNASITTSGFLEVVPSGLNK